jgi:hypothetical protein
MTIIPDDESARPKGHQTRLSVRLAAGKHKIAKTVRPGVIACQTKAIPGGAFTVMCTGRKHSDG